MEQEELYKRPEEDLFDLPDLEFEDKSYTRICCPSCNHKAKADDLSIQDKVAKCSNCHVVFSFKKALQSIDSVPQKIKQEILNPEGIELFSYRDDLEISFKEPFSGMEWLVSSVAFFPAFILFLNSMKYGFSFTSIAVLSVIGVIGAIFSYFRFKQLVYLTINDNNLDIHRRPKLLHHRKSYATGDIDQIYIKHKPDMALWKIMMIINKGKGQEHLELTAVNSISKAKYLEQEIERHLNIQDVHVPEEDG